VPKLSTLFIPTLFQKHLKMKKFYKVKTKINNVNTMLETLDLVTYADTNAKPT